MYLSLGCWRTKLKQAYLGNTKTETVLRRGLKIKDGIKEFGKNQTIPIPGS